VRARDDGLGETKAAKGTLRKGDEVLMVRLETDENQVTTEVERVTYQLRNTSGSGTEVVLSEGCIYARITTYLSAHVPIILVISAIRLVFSSLGSREVAQL
jgi:hypothetical protein